MRQLKAIAVLLLLCSVAQARWCNSPYCEMCARVFGPIPGYEYLWQRAQTIVDPRGGPNIIRVPAIASTPHSVVVQMLAALELTPDDVLYDLGCGDGRICIAAAKTYGCLCLGIEKNAEVAKVARLNVQLSGVKGIHIQTADMLTLNLRAATAVTIYQMPPLIAKIMPKLATTRVVSYQHKLPGPCLEINSHKGIIYLLQSKPLFEFGKW